MEIKMKKLKVILKYAGVVYEVTGKTLEEIELSSETSLLDILKELTLKYGPRFKEEVFDYEMCKPAPQIIILLNGRLVQDYNVKVNDGDFVSIIPMASGG
jgi:MoaD family protein